MEYEKILFSRLILSFFWTVVLQFFPLSLYIFISNVDFVHPLDWIANSTLLVFKFETWFSLIPLQLLLFVLGYLFLQEFKKPPALISSRFKLLLSFFTNINIFKGILHVLLGLVLPWIYLKFDCIFLTKQCQDSPQNFCVDEKSVFIAACCVWTGVYYFVRNDLLSDKYLEFPIIRQLRFLQIRSRFPAVLESSFKLSIIPSFYFLLIYLFYEKQIISIFEFFLSASVEPSSARVFSLFNISMLLKAWLMSSVYFCLIETVKLMMHILFTERYSFALLKQPNSNEVLLSTALKEWNTPIIHHLACYDLYILSLNQKSIRWQIFTLSQPGGHPHTWNVILHESLKLIEKFICEVEEIYQVPEPVKPKSIVPRHYHPRADCTHEETVPVSPHKKLRNLIDHPDKFVIQREQVQESTMGSVWGKIESYLDLIQKNSVVNYVFGVKPDAKIRFLVSNSQPLIWVIQSISELAANALMEDQFGIVLKDLPLIINTLLRLKCSLDKLGNIQRKFQKQDHDLCMKASLKSALKRSLYRIAIAYSDYLTDLPLTSENLNIMNNFVNFKEC